MDTLLAVDCFERLHAHLLAEVPDLHGFRERTAPAPPPADQSLDFLLDTLLRLLLKLPADTPETYRRLRLLRAEPADPPPARPGTPSLAALQPTKRAHLEAAREALRTLAEEAPAAPGLHLAGTLTKLEHLPARIAWLARLLPCLPPLDLFRFLDATGYPLLLPELPIRRFLHRLGLLVHAPGSDVASLCSTCQVGDTLADLLKRPPHEIQTWTMVFTGMIPGAPPPAALCSRIPRCEACPLAPLCRYFQSERPRSAGAERRLSVKNWRPVDKPREKMLRRGPAETDDRDLLAVLLGTGAPGQDVATLALFLLEHYGTIGGLAHAPFDDLRKIKGVGSVKAIRLQAAFELGRRALVTPLQPGDPFTHPSQIFLTFRGRFASILQEEFHLLLLNTKNQLIREELISRGGLDAATVHPREIFKAALAASAASVLCVHNHPSGNPEPSPEDRAITLRLQKAAELLQIRFLDHVIIGNGCYYSFTDGAVAQVPSAQPEARP